MAIHKEMLFMKKLISTGSETIYAAVYDYLHKNGILMSNLLQIATDGVSTMTDKHNGFVAKLNGHDSYLCSSHENTGL